MAAGSGVLANDLTIAREDSSRLDPAPSSAQIRSATQPCEEASLDVEDREPSGDRGGMIVHLTAFALAVGLTLAALGMHYEALRLLSVVPQVTRISARLKTLLVIIGAISAHIAEAVAFAVGYWVGEAPLHLGRFVGSGELGANGQLGPLQLLYFSLEAFTTQGLGDVYPVGPLRLVASLEPLAGLILIGWSTSFTFLVMRRYWRLKSDATVRTTSKELD
jgi:Ion channel